MLDYNLFNLNEKILDEVLKSIEIDKEEDCIDLT